MSLMTLTPLKECKNLKNLSLSNNKFKDIETLEPLKDLELLTHFDIMEGNEFDDPDTRTKVFKLLPHLQFLDGVDKDGNDAKSEEDGEEEEELDDEDSGEEEEESESDDDD